MENMEARHTQGEWTVYRRQIGQYTVEKTSNGLRSIICTIYGGELCNEHGGNPEANAHLIAAAPELLEALKTIVNVPTYKHVDMIDAMINAQRAIAKAEGESK